MRSWVRFWLSQYCLMPHQLPRQLTRGCHVDDTWYEVRDPEAMIGWVYEVRGLDIGLGYELIIGLSVRGTSLGQRANDWQWVQFEMILGMWDLLLTRGGGCPMTACHVEGSDMSGADVQVRVGAVRGKDFEAIIEASRRTGGMH
nr:hypothetical protein [Tanacetum cinerariifolium]